MPVVMTNLVDSDELQALVVRAKGGDREALEKIVVALQDDVYRLALRMTEVDPNFWTRR
jgi:hypothetical protein